MSKQAKKITVEILQQKQQQQGKKEINHAHKDRDRDSASTNSGRLSERLHSRFLYGELAKRKKFNREDFKQIKFE